MEPIDQLRWLSSDQARELARRYYTPLFAYSEAELLRQAERLLNLSLPYGLSVRYAIKANPNRSLLRLFDRAGLHFDAGSGWEATRAMLAGVKPDKILLTAQELPVNLPKLIKKGVNFTATSLHQLEAYGRQFRGREVSLRINPGFGSGHSEHVTVGGKNASFGIWHEQVGRAADTVANYQLKVKRIHVHIGSGSDPALWVSAAEAALVVLRRFPSADILNVGGGFKVARAATETEVDLAELSEQMSDRLRQFASSTGRRVRLEIEPGTFLVANAGSLVASVDDIVTTGASGHKFLKLNCGLSEIMRPILYGAYHPIVVVKDTPETDNYVVVGHSCEAGDLLSVDSLNSTKPAPRRLARASIGDTVVIEGAGAYCASLGAVNFVSFPQAPEILVKANGKFKTIRKRQNLYQMIANER